MTPKEIFMLFVLAVVCFIALIVFTFFATQQNANRRLRLRDTEIAACQRLTDPLPCLINVYTKG